MGKQHFRILIKSVGTARPSASTAVAKGLGLPASTVVSRLYSAPAILIDGIDEAIARRMVTLLCDIGYEAEAQDSATPAPTPSPLYDVAIYIKDARQFQHVVQKLANFIGISEDDTTRMLLQPPGIILGSVSEAIVSTLSDQLGAEISVLSSQAEKARYDLFLSEDAGIVHERIVQEISSAGLELCGASGLVATDVPHSTAQKLWQRHQTSGLLHVVNQEFLHFDLILQKSVAESAPDTGQIEVLEKLAGVPAEMAEEVLQAAPITLLESVPNKEVAHYLTIFAEAGLIVSANLITFQMLGVEVLSLSNRAALSQALEGFGLQKPGKPLPRVPFRLPGVMPELQARIIRATLEDTGARVALVEAST